jgi:K+/H+ antiporter YhaU regulatory subunit KhtT
MPVELQETRLPGVGVKYRFPLDGGGKSLADSALRAKTGVTVIAILREPEPISGARPGDVIHRGATLITVGKAGQYAAFRRALEGR